MPKKVARTTEQDAEQKRKVRLKDDQFDMDIREVLAIPAGVRVMQAIADQGDILIDPMTGNSQTYFNLGYQAFSRWLIARILRAVGIEMAAEVAFAKTKRILEEDKEGVNNV